MSSSYLEAARRILLARARPSSAQDILRDVVKFELLPPGLSGETMHKTLQARIAEEISENKEDSAFYRTAPGMYFLRELASDPTFSYSGVSELEATGRRRPSSTGRVLHLHMIQAANETDWLDTSETLAQLSERGIYAELGGAPRGAIPIATFSILCSNGKYLTHVVGKHSMFPRSVGRLSIGFSRYLDEFDRDLFSSDDLGVDMSAAREILRNTFLRSPDVWLDDLELRSSIKPLTFFIDKYDAVAWLALGVNCGVDITSAPIRRRLDVNKPQWREFQEIDELELENVSAKILKSGFIE